MFNLNNMSWGTREINTKIVNHKCDKQIVKKNWTDHELLVKYEKKQMNKSEMKFFENLIDKYLHPLIDEQKEKEKIIQISEIKTADDCIDALNQNYDKRIFEKDITTILEQIEMFQKKRETIKEVLLQKFDATEISYSKFDGVISDIESHLT